MKKALLIWAVAVILVMTGSAAWAQASTPAVFTPGSVSFDEGSGIETFSAGVIGQPSSGTLAFGDQTGESLIVTGTVGTGTPLTPGTRAVLFTGAGDLPVSTPAGTVNLSDYVLATVSANGLSLTLRFESNESPTFDSGIALIPAGSSSIAETGDFQGIGSVLIDGTALPGLNVNELTTVSMRSDLDVVVPLPSSALLLGSGLLSLAGWRRFRKG